MLYFAVGFAVIGGLAFGWDLGVIGGAEQYLQEDLKLGDGELTAVVTAAKCGAIAGVVLGAVLFDVLGRRKALGFTGLFYTIGPLVLSFANGVGALVFGRLLVGMGVGSSSVVTTAYLGEISTPSWRGRIIVCIELALALGNILSLLVDWALSGRWRIMMGIPAALGILLLGAPLVLPESPRWLVVRGRVDEALRVIGILRGGPRNEESAHSGNDSSAVVRATERAERELIMLWSSTEKERDKRRADLETVGFVLGSTKGGCAQFFRARVYELRVLWTGPEGSQFRLVLFLALVNQLSASSAIINYSPRLLEAVGVDDKGTETLLTGLVAGFKLAGILLGFILVDRVGRRALLIYGSALCCVAMILVAVSQMLPSDKGLAAPATLASVVLFIFSFAASHATVFGVVAGEVFSMHFKSVALASAGVVLFAGGAIANAVFLPFLRWGPACFLAFALVMLFAAVVVKGELPETKGLELSEVRARFAAAADIPPAAAGRFPRLAAAICCYQRCRCCCRFAHWNSSTAAGNALLLSQHSSDATPDAANRSNDDIGVNSVSGDVTDLPARFGKNRGVELASI